MITVRVKNDMPEGFYGFYGERRRYPGQQFEIQSEADFSDNWMERVTKRGRKSGASDEDGAE